MIFSDQVEGTKRTSWFRHRVVERYKQDKYRYKEGFQIDGFLAFILPEIQQEFKSCYEKTDERARTVMYFDKALALTPTPDHEEITRLLAYHDAYIDYFDNRFTLIDELKAIIEIEMDLEDTNHFNKLSPIEVFDYFFQLTQRNPQNKEPFLTEKQVYDLTNMICRDQPVTNPIRMNMFLAIFQKTSSGSSRGGASVDYDASMVINMTREKGSGKRVAHMRKSRYGTQGWCYYPEENTVVSF